MRSLGLDIGTNRIGVAMSDETGLIAQPLKTLEVRGSFKQAVEEIKELVGEKKVEVIVVGLPLSLAGEEGGESVHRAKKIGAEIEGALGIEVVYWDERFSTAEATRSLIGAGMRRKDRREVVDKVAASIFLQSYLDAQSKDS